MDDYGIGSAASMGVQLFEHASRRSGRTTRMLERVNNDDLIVCRHSEAERIRRLLKDMGKTTRVTAVEHADELDRIGARAKGRAVFDHDWVRQFFVDAIRSAENDLRHMADRFSSVPPDRKAERQHQMNMQRRNQFEA